MSLAVALAAVCTPVPAAIAAPTAPPAPPSGPAVHVTYLASYPASLYWLLNALAGDDHVNCEAYRAYWASHGPADPGDAAMLASFARLRAAYRGALPVREARENPYLPVPPASGTDVRERFANMFLGARTMPEAWARADGLLAEDDAAELGRIVRHFEPRFAKLWKTWRYLGAYRTAFTRYAHDGGLDAWLGKAARFYGVAPGTPMSPQVNFVFTPPAATTHGRKVGANLVVEVVPGEAPGDRVDVVAHELSHYLFERAGLEDDPRFVSSFFETGGADASGALGLVNEAFATAIGQGVVAEALAPAEFARRRMHPGSWYNDPAIERYAKAIFPLVKQALADGRTATGLVPTVVGAYRSATAGTAATPASVLASYMLVLDDRHDPAFGDYFKRIPPRSLFGQTVDGGGRMWSKYRGLPGLVALTADDLVDLASHATDYGLAADEVARLRRAEPGVLTKTRPTGGDLFLVVGRDRRQLGRALARFATLDHITPGWTPLP